MICAMLRYFVLAPRDRFEYLPGPEAGVALICYFADQLRKTWHDGSPLDPSALGETKRIHVVASIIRIGFWGFHIISIV